ncbi:hypothetical protein VOLCADRAFT_90515 [Volvox carteri f. nagariensis]|uniref:Zinc finger C3HC4 RING-type domain-containing protein n=1 Tax=Volvox carteri f. nagariensis TaxID=3068 RepID=D8TUL1_VOLCA|nr:uncharacterized protein VOLCADRAFT_90515 [Volvox carteri f. nagariensis]EFJ48727.1 hypothetical protein VOLCADRAFT_90515 [Volvox carteri f. nagariensis]|eukprot:XP_002950059.1 hypothetical protein VOLCADRAFT_90515 [Volvox carteri f. nagariensis]
MQRRGGSNDRPEDPLAEELREKTLALISVQRNYESISRLMQLKQQELEQIQTTLAAEQATSVSLGVQLEESRGRCASLEKQLEGLKKLPAMVAELEAERESLKRDAAQANVRALALQEAMKGLRHSLEEEQHNNERQRQQLEVAGQEDTIRGLQDEVRTLTQLSHELRSAAHASEVALAAARGTQAVLEAQLRGAQRSGEVGRQLQEELAAKLAAAEGALAANKSAMDSREEEMSQLRTLMNDLEERYQASLSGKLAADEVSNGLQLQLAQTRGSLVDARRRAAAAEQEAARTAAEAAEASRAAAARAANAARLVSAVQYRASEVGGLLAARVDAVSERLLGRLEERLGRGLAEEAERVDKALTGTLLVEPDAWLRLWVAFAVISYALPYMWLRNAQVRGDAAALRSRVEELTGALAGEVAARQMLAHSKAAMEAEHRAALQAAQTAADERVEAERQRLGARLKAVEEEVGRLTHTHQRETAAAARAWESERQQLVRRLDELSTELARAREVNADHSNALAVLHTQLNAELQAAKEQYDRELKQYREQLDSVRTHVRGTWSTCSRLATDLALVARHLARMGVGLPDGAGELPAGLHGVGDDGSGGLLEQLAAAVRLGFGQLAEGVQGMVRRLQTLQAQNLELEAKSPVTLVPCGHTFCRRCLTNANGLCSECGADMPAAVTVANSPLDAICAKYELKRSALAAIQRALQQAGEGAAAGGGGGYGHGHGHAGRASGVVAAAPPPLAHIPASWWRRPLPSAILILILARIPTLLFPARTLERATKRPRNADPADEVPLEPPRTRGGSPPAGAAAAAALAGAAAGAGAGAGAEAGPPLAGAPMSVLPTALPDWAREALKGVDPFWQPKETLAVIVTRQSAPAPGTHGQLQCASALFTVSPSALEAVAERRAQARLADQAVDLSGGLVRGANRLTLLWPVGAAGAVAALRLCEPTSAADLRRNLPPPLPLTEAVALVQTWVCPATGRLGDLGDLRPHAFLSAVMRTLEHNGIQRRVEAIEVAPDGGWRPKDSRLPFMSVLDADPRDPAVRSLPSFDVRLLEPEDDGGRDVVDLTDD